MRPAAKSLWWAAGALAAAPILYPIINPDLFWHLSAARWMVDHGALPRADFLSFTAPGRPWVDFEWLGQLLFLAAHSAGGLTGVWVLKTLLLSASAALLERTLARRGCGLPLRLAALALWSGGMLAHCDIRPDLFSLLFLGALVYAGEAGLLRKPALPGLGGVALVFLLWPNLHGGFPLGWFLLLCYALAGGSWLPLLVSGPATLFNPYGWGPLRVVLAHWRQSTDISRVIMEWKPLDFANPVYWPLWGLLVLAAFAASFAAAASFRLGGKKRLSWPLLAATAALGLMTLRHERSGPYFTVCAAALLPLLARDMGLEDSPWTRRSAAGWALAFGAFLGWLVPRAVWSTEFNYKFVPRAAAEFMARERAVLEPLRLYNQWEWGGYLAWRLRPWYRVYWDGRYIFQGELAQAERAIQGPDDWRAFMEAGRLDGALMVNLSKMLPAQKRYPDGSLKDFPRPWHVFFMPKERWALVYWDPKAMLFVDRKKAPKDWLARHEYRYARPDDGAALMEGLRLKEVPKPAFLAEDERHERELDEFGGRHRP
ncbi:MAG: hypothetical protein HY926_01195 [Elusimicrobia bacterium]|nr:hypothetical protein [Elusimicrobiota bacterium]